MYWGYCFLINISISLSPQNIYVYSGLYFFHELTQNFIFSGIFLLLGLLNSNLLSPLNKIWIKFGEILGIIIAPIIMALVYFVILTPVSLVVRVFGKDLLGLKFTNKQQTYWINRKKNMGSMRKQF